MAGYEEEMDDREVIMLVLVAGRGARMRVGLTLKSQNLQGKLPPELVKFPYLQEIDLSRNYLNGTIPPEWASLPLVNIVVEFNLLSGAIPAELGDLPRIERIVIQGSGFDGPIPPGIGHMTNMSDLRISDLNGNDTTSATFPPLRNLTQLKYLILRSCNMNGSLPEYRDLGDTTNLKVLLVHIDAFSAYLFACHLVTSL
ncbi:Leucine-rich repeat receptor-like serine/threonine-protein kinase precursor [Actinidia chinensis var. chinensis]|uniref:Leucine-rich repeat receptor-like serine/threonine-protein kinase n=1 Tax=Actinidia chinensis var. chinensis TaxID=1590841 RepID=A0A2R6NXA2_ACTCC|nr:Leucine-rich repeat receptor-like serine/threonine-protein kinase precursor [Actinidia chinensis var. chinensis]